MNPCNQYDREQLQRLLNEALPDAVEVSVSEHVAACPACQQELEALAAKQEWWIEAGQRLCKSAIELASLHTQSSDLSRGGDVPIGNDPFAELSDDAYATDFAVDFLEPSDNPSVLGRLGEYEILDVIGRGGMGVVLKGFQKELHRFVAVKVLSPHLATSGAARRRFAREAQATAAVVNPHVMAIHSVHANSKLPYLVMQFIECQSLQQRIDQQGPLDVKDVLRIGMQAALGLAAAHAQGLVHRDIKPANILLEANVDRVMLTDFGLARAVDDATLTRTGVIAGTPQYMSPERANGDAIDHRSDLFSLGSVLYAMCTARPPFRAETTFGVLRRIRETEPRMIREINPDVPEWLSQIITNLLAKNPYERISTASEVAELFEKCLAHLQQPTVVPFPTSAILRTNVHSSMSIAGSRKQTIAFWTVGTIILILAGMFFWPRHPVSESRNEHASSLLTKNDASADPGNRAKEMIEAGDPSFDWNQSKIEIQNVDRTLMQIESSVASDIEAIEATEMENRK